MRENGWLIAICSTYLLFGFAYSVLLPPLEAPDENAHYGYVLHLVNNSRLPTIADTYESAQPPLYYWFTSWPLRAINAIEPNLVNLNTPKANPENIGKPLPVYEWSEATYRFDRLLGLMALRWIGVLSGGAALFFIYKGALRFSGRSSRVALATIAAAGLTPQFLHISASVNNDVLAILIGAMLFWLLAYVIHELPSWPLLVLILMAAVLASLLVKLTLLPVTLTVIMASGWQASRLLGSLRSRAFAIGLLAFVMLIVAATLLTTAVGRNALSEFGWRLTFVRPDAFRPFEIMNRYAQTYWARVGWVAVGFSDKLDGLLSSAAALGSLAALRLLFPKVLTDGTWRRPFVADKRFFFLSVALLLLLIAVIKFAVESILITQQLQFAWFLVGIAWLVWWFVSKPSPLGTRTGWLFVWSAVALNLIVLGRNALATDKFQGRFLFPSIGILMLLTTTGLYIMLPAKFRKFFVPVVVVFMISLNLFLWFSGIIPVYYQPWLD